MPEPLDLFENLYNTADVPLGSLVPDTTQPHEDSWRPGGLEENTHYSVKVNKNISWRTDSFSDAWFSVQVLGWLKALLERDRQRHFRVTARKGYVYHLSAPKQTLRDICADPKAREWLEDAAGTGPVHMVTELCTMVNPALERADGRSTAAEGRGPVTDGTITYADLGGGGARGSGEGGALVARGERIYKIKFRKVKLSFARYGKEGPAGPDVIPTLKQGYWWKPLLATRGEEDEDADGRELVVEVDLADEEEEIGGSGESDDEYDEEYDSEEGSFEEEEGEDEEDEDSDRVRGKSKE
ncbi:hypothetical protein VTI74DRAFT_5389 [Chaetomium olivicolor]